MISKEKGRRVLKVMGIAMLFASGFSWWQAGVEERLAGFAFWRTFFALEAIFAALICIVAATLLLAHCADQEFKELS